MLHEVDSSVEFEGATYPHGALQIKYKDGREKWVSKGAANAVLRDVQAGPSLNQHEEGEIQPSQSHEALFTATQQPDRVSDAQVQLTQTLDQERSTDLLDRSEDLNRIQTYQNS